MFNYILFIICLKYCIWLLLNILLQWSSQATSIQYSTYHNWLARSWTHGFNLTGYLLAYLLMYLFLLKFYSILSNILMRYSLLIHFPLMKWYTSSVFFHLYQLKYLDCSADLILAMDLLLFIPHCWSYRKAITKKWASDSLCRKIIGNVP